MTMQNEIRRVDAGEPVGAKPGQSPDASARASEFALPEDVVCIVPVRNVVLFPGIVMPLSLGRPKSIAAAQEAARAQRPIGVLLQRAAEADHIGEDAAERRSGECRDERDRAERHAALQLVVAAVDEERPREALRQVVGELVEDHEGQDLERAMAGQHAHDGQPDRVAQTARRHRLALGLGRQRGHQQEGQVGAGEPGADEPPRVAAGECDG